MSVMIHTFRGRGFPLAKTRRSIEKCTSAGASARTAWLVGCVVLVLAIPGSAGAVKFHKKCESNILAADRDMVLELADYLLAHSDKILAEADADPYDRNFVQISSEAAWEWKTQIEEFHDGKLTVDCRYEGDGRSKKTTTCFDDDSTLGHAPSGGPITLCLSKMAGVSNAEKVEVLAHELMHTGKNKKTEKPKHDGACYDGTDQLIATSGNVFSVDVPADSHPARCLEVKDCPSSSGTITCEGQGGTMCENPNKLSETIGCAAKDYSARPDLSLEIDYVAVERSNELRVDATVRNHNGFDDANWIGLPSPYYVHAALFVAGHDVPVVNHCYDLRGIGYEEDELPSECYTELNATLRLYLPPITHGEPLHIRLVTPLSEDLLTAQRDVEEVLVEAIVDFGDLIPYEVNEKNNYDLAHIVVRPDVELPILFLGDVQAKAESGELCPDLSGIPALGNEDLRWITAEDRLGRRLEKRCFDVAPNDFAGNLPHQNWDDFCTDICLSSVDPNLVEYGLATVNDRTTTHNFEEETPDACTDLGSVTNKQGAATTYSAWNTGVKGSGTCGCTCVLNR